MSKLTKEFIHTLYKDNSYIIKTDNLYCRPLVLEDFDLIKEIIIKKQI
ncbi:hypothetical protein [Rickettsiales endosymbiont of Stachyamoeba lipophora]|nr:hypothetical protein [Rickettsiales endosymbiont of Stachyamoeba lipophora]